MERASGELVKKLKKQKRENDFLLFLDNPKIINDAIQMGAKPKIALAVNQEDLPKIDCEKYITTKSVIDDLADVKTPQGVVVMLEYSQDIVKKPKSNFLVLDKIQDPGNCGSLIRSALAFGFERVFILDGVKVTNSKLIRSSAGAALNLPVHNMKREDFIRFVKKNSLNLAKTDMQGQNIFSFKPSKPIGIVIGNEGQGVSEQISSLCSVTLTIPMQSGIESLNAAVSGSIIMALVQNSNKKN